MIAMATYIFHRLIMGQVEIDNFSVSMGFGFFTEMIIKLSSMFHITFVQIFARATKSVNVWKKMLKNLLLRNHKV